MSKNVEAVYLLSPLQQGMLYETLSAPGSGVYVNQVVHTLDGLDAAAYRAAWTRVVERHPALRTLFLWERRERPVQAVVRGTALPWEEADWRGVPAAEHDARLEAWLHADRARGYTLSREPLMRLFLARTGEAEHRSVWSFHHLVLDGWSISLVMGEVMAVYAALCEGREPALDPAPGFGAYVAWLGRQDLDGARAYWRGALAGITAPTPLGVDRPAGAAADDPARFGARYATVPAETRDALQAFARAHGLTLNTLVQGAWALLLGRYSGEDDVVFGVTVSGRPGDLEGADRTVGPFINSIPARVRLPADQEVLSWLRALHLDHAERQQFDFSPLVEVQGWSEVPRGRPMFESLFVFQNYPSGGGERARTGLGVRSGRVAESTGVPVVVSVSNGGEMSLKVLHDRARVDDDAAQRLLEHYAALLAELPADGARPLGRVPLATGAERERVLRAWNRTERGYPAVCMHELVQAQVRRTPDAVAVVSGTRRVTFDEVNRRANRLAHHLRGMGVGPEARVGVCLERTDELVVALLAVLKAGAAYVPLDPTYPAERVGWMLEDSRAAVIVTQASLRERLPATDAALVLVDGDAAAIARESGDDPVSGAVPANLAYLIYTSGSTGRPKAVALQHASASTFLHWARDAFAPEERAVVLASTSVCFDLSVYELFGPLAWGDRLVMAANALALPELPARGEVTLVNTVPSAAAELARMGALPPSVVTVNLAGEALKRELADALYALPHVRAVCNLYGPSEDTTYSTWTRVPRVGPVTIGAPLADTRAYVVDPRMQPVPAGVPGELYLAGEGLARGYLGRPALTAERFVPDPFGPPGGRAYRTGDRVRWNGAGELEFLGRLDHQVKIRGFRIEPGEVEALLCALPGVRDGAVLVRQDAGEPRLVAYAVPAGADAPVGPAELRAALARRLPGYMVPSAFVMMEALPLTPNGKLDRRALPAPGAEGEGAGFVAPRDGMELAVAQVWEAVLGVSPVGVTDSFFALGGHSLLALRLVARMEEKLGRAVPLAVLQAEPTVEHLACHLRAAPHAGARRGGPVPLRPGGTLAPLFVVAGGDGHVLAYAPLARRLDPAHPLLGLQSRGLEDGAAPLETIEEIAADHVATVRTARPEGPYLLGGWSTGAVVAFEMARQLAAAGEEVAALVMVDPHRRVTEEGDDDALASFAGLFGGRLPDGVTAEALRGLDPAARLDLMVERARAARLLPPDVGPERLRALLAVRRANGAAQARYRPEPFLDAPVTLVQATERASDAHRASADAWLEMVPAAERHVIPGNHFSMMREPHVGALAEVFAAALELATAEVAA